MVVGPLARTELHQSMPKKTSVLQWSNTEGITLVDIDQHGVESPREWLSCQFGQSSYDATLSAYIYTDHPKWYAGVFIRNVGIILVGVKDDLRQLAHALFFQRTHTIEACKAQSLEVSP